MARLRRLAARSAAGSSDRHLDLYVGVDLVFAGLAHGEPRLGLTALGGIFADAACPHLKGAKLANADLLAALRSLRYIDAGRKLFPINYRDMGAEEFGSVYEGILELVPNYTAATQTFSLVGAAGNNRKTTGSYYTPSSLVDRQIESALVPLIDRCRQAPAPEESLLSLKVIDTSCGSGHFVVAAARRLASALVELRGSDSSPEAYQRALRDVVCNAIYGVDINPLAVELAKITLWIESVVPGQPLSFLDAHFVCGDATLGIDNLKNLENGIPAAAYKPLVGDDKTIAQELGNKNRAELKVLEKERKSGQLHLPTNTGNLAAEIAKIAALPETTLAEVEAKKTAYARYLSGIASNRLVQAANLFTAAFLLPKNANDGRGTRDACPTTGNLLSLLTGSIVYEPPTPEMQSAADAACCTARVLHWPLVFPEVFEKGGFDCVLTNPPWDQLQVSEEEFFAPRDPSISALAGAKRKAAIAMLRETNPALYRQFQDAVTRQNKANEFIGESGRFPLSTVGKLNLYSILAETITHVVNGNGYAGAVLPTGICTDDSNKALFGFLISQQRLVSLYDFENAASGKRLFEAVHPQFKISLITLGHSAVTDFAFFLGHPSDLADERRHFTLATEDLRLINPNTHTAPVFRSKADAELAKRIYRKVGVLWDVARSDGNPWKISFRQGLFNMTSASNLFLTADQLPTALTQRAQSSQRDAEGFEEDSPAPNSQLPTQTSNSSLRPFASSAFFASAPAGSHNPVNPVEKDLRDSVPPCENYLPLYEAKMIHQFDHRWTTYEPGESDVRDITLDEKQNPTYEPRPRYWVEEKHLVDRFDGVPPNFLLGFRDIARSTDVRTAIASILPLTPVGHTMPLIEMASTPQLIACFLGAINSIPFDWIVRLKIGGTHLTYTYLKQIATLAPTAYTQADIDFIVPRVLELTYTSYSLKGWAEALGYTGEPFKFDPERRAVLRAELDARYAKLYGLDERELTYILDPSAVYGPDYPSESFRVLKEKELAEFGEYRTMRMVLEAFRKEAGV